MTLSRIWIIAGLDVGAYPLFGAIKGLIGASPLRKPPGAAASNEGGTET